MIACNMKQLKLGYFNTNSKKFTVTVFFFQKETKTASKGQYYFVKYIKEFWLFSDNCRLFQKISEDYRRFPTTAEDFGRLRNISLKTATAPLSPGSKLMTDFVTYFPKADKN